MQSRIDCICTLFLQIAFSYVSNHLLVTKFIKLILHLLHLLHLEEGQHPHFFAPSVYLVFCLFSSTYFGLFSYFFIIFVCLHGIDVLRHNLTNPLLFYHSLSIYHKVNTLHHILTLSPLFYIFCLVIKIQLKNYHKFNILRCIFTLPPLFYCFCLEFKINFVPQISWGLPLFFLQFLSVLTCLMFSDIIWPPPQTWNLSKILHRRIFRLKILHCRRHWRHGQIPPPPEKKNWFSLIFTSAMC